MVDVLDEDAVPDRRRPPLAWVWHRELERYPARAARIRNLTIVVLATIILYYELYVSSSVTTLLLADLDMSFLYLVIALAVGNFVGAFGSLAAGLTDRFGRANLVVYGLLVVGLLTLVAVPNVRTAFGFAATYCAVGFVEGIILVATPALIRDFSPQVGRATAMGFWTMGPVVGSLVVSAVASTTLPAYETWQSQYVICGIAGLVLFAVAFVGLRELSPRLRDQLMVSERDRALVEARARGVDVEASLRHPWRQLLHLDVVASATAVSLMLLVYYTAVAFFVVYMVTIFGFGVTEANALANWNWGANAVALLVAGVLSDRLRVRKPFMFAGGLGAAAMLVVFLLQARGDPSFATLAVIVSLLSVMLGFAYATWMASFTETVEARNPALTGTGLAIWGWILRVVVTLAFLAIPLVVNTVTTLVAAPPYLEAYEKAERSGAEPGPELLSHLAEIRRAAADSPGQWQSWYWICVGGIVVFLLLVPVTKGRWSPRAALRDQQEHDAAVRAELARIRGTDPAG